MALGHPPSPLHATVSFAAELARHGAAPALVTRESTLSYAELADRVEEVVRQLGTTRRLVLVAGANAVEPVVAYLAALAAGHPVLLVPGENPAALSGLLEAYDPDVVAGPLASGEWRLEERREGTAHELHPDLALLLSTSGSTGSPKLVRLSHENVESNAAAIAAYLQIRDDDRAATTLPMHYCYGLSVINSHLLSGAALVLTGLSVVDACFWELFQRVRGTSLAGVPYTFELLDRVGFAEMELPHLRYVTQAGGRLAPERVARYAALGRSRGWDLFVMYGQTEATARMAYLPPNLAAAHPQAIGIPIPGGSFALEPLAGLEDPGAGELVYRGPNVMLGYAESPQDLACGRVVDALRTGDIARRSADGLYEIVGRRSRFAKVLGLRIDLERAEAVLAGHGLPAWCASADDGLVVALEGAGDTGEVWRLAARELGIPAGAVRVLELPELPRLASGKPDHDALAKLARAVDEPGAADRAGAPDGTVVDLAVLCALFADVLDRPHVDGDSTFVGLGGDSLSYVELSVALEATLGRLPPGWHVTPIRELVAEDGTAPRRAGSRVVETSVALRAIAIVLIVGTHAGLFAILGGAHLLVAVAGFNFARFQLGPGSRFERLRGQLTSVARIALPSVAWILLAALLITDDYRVANVLLVNALVGPETWSVQWHFWFVEVLLYLLIGLAALLAIPAVDRAERRWPLGVALALLGVGLLSRFHLLDLGILSPRPVLWLFALGWAAARARSVGQRALVTALVVATVPGFFGDPERELLIAGGILLLLWAPSVRCPAALSRVAAVLASASLYIYLTHWQVYRPLADIPVLAMAASLAAGVAYWLAVTHGMRLAKRVPPHPSADHSQAYPSPSPSRPFSSRRARRARGLPPGGAPPPVHRPAR